MTDLTEIMATIQEGSVVTFKEYTLDRRGRKHLSLSIEDAIVHRVIPAGEKLGIDDLQQLYGTDLGETTYLSLSESSCLRVVLSLGIDQDGAMAIKIITLVAYSLQEGLQEISIGDPLDGYDPTVAEPNYLMGIRAFT